MGTIYRIIYPFDVLIDEPSLGTISKVQRRQQKETSDHFCRPPHPPQKEAR